MGRHERGRDEWRLISGALADISEALEVFRPRRDTRKITVFGSARTVQSDPRYAFAEELADQFLVRERGEVIARGPGSEMKEKNIQQLVAI